MSNLSNNNISSINLLSLSARSYNTLSIIPDVGFLIETKSSIQLNYLILNTEIDYSDTNNAFGELITENYYDNNFVDMFSPHHLFILPNNTFIQMIANKGSLTFLSRDFSSMMPKSMYNYNIWFF